MINQCVSAGVAGEPLVSPRDDASAIQSGHPSAQSCDTWQSTARLNQYSAFSQRKPDRLDSVKITEKPD